MLCYWKQEWVADIDATNVVKKPIAVIIASIGMDHMQFLGDTIEKIAAEKAGS